MKLRGHEFVEILGWQLYLVCWPVHVHDEFREASLRSTTAGNTYVELAKTVTIKKYFI